MTTYVARLILGNDVGLADWRRCKWCIKDGKNLGNKQWRGGIGARGGHGPPEVIFKGRQNENFN